MVFGKLSFENWHVCNSKERDEFVALLIKFLEEYLNYNDNELSMMIQLVQSNTRWIHNMLFSLGLFGWSGSLSKCYIKANWVGLA